ncbi:hypothetical protein [Hymenobacter defluvii]|uniref:Uncharacterized protein n=1 Tax=Hymenobacter defluvii TaxID=2054411 RepID=A0ABS3THI2_9BACT|nr:hypothetical protein [Hymenobacter defluvii]MBO3273132.1 hypothetical protein [Hymenobacter defluvii]
MTARSFTETCKLRQRTTIYGRNILGFGVLLLLFIASKYEGKGYSDYFVLYIFVLIFVVVLSMMNAYKSKPNKILLLRPFNVSSSSKFLKKIVKREISFAGYTFTLEDKYLKNNVFKDKILDFIFKLGRVTYFLSPISCSIHKKSNLDELESLLNNNWKLAWQYLIYGDRLIKISSSDFYWQRTVELIAENVDIVLFDISEIGPGSVWEISQVKRFINYKKVIFICNKADNINARRIIRKFFPDVEAKVFDYENGEFKDKQIFI